VIRIERDPAWWTAIAEHPAVECAMLGMPPSVVGGLCLRSDVLPLAAEHGGFYFARCDAFGFVCEMHALFTPEGWGRQALVAANEAINAVWICDYQVITALETDSNPRARPPRSFGFVPSGDWRETVIGPVRMWVLTRAAWAASPAKRRGLVN
jgi:hypothetical protein